LKRKVGSRTSKRSPDGVSKEVKARTKDGELITLKSTGKSKMQMIKEKQEAEKWKRRKRRRKHRGS
jgi:ArsR family metal-binding transcriptional regulator